MRRTSLTLTALAAAACLTLAGCSGSSKNASATPSAQASPTLTRSIIDCAQEAGKIETDSEALPAIGGDAGAEPTVTWSEGKQAPANLVSKTLTAAEGPAVSSGDVVTVNSRVGSKYIIRTRGDRKDKFLAALDRNSDWLKLRPGVNEFQITMNDPTLTDVYFSTDVLYQGV